MLIFSRKPGQALAIYPQSHLDPGTPVSELFAGGPIRVQVFVARGRDVRVGVAAHAGLCVLREEQLPMLAAGPLPEDARRTLARKLRALMFVRRHSAESLAAAAGVPVDRVVAAGRGAGVLFVDDLERLARALGVSVAELFRSTGNTPEERVILAMLESKEE